MSITKKITDIDCLKGLKGLKKLEVRFTNIDSLKGLKKLKVRYLYNNKITDIDSLKNLKKPDDIQI